MSLKTLLAGTALATMVAFSANATTFSTLQIANSLFQDPAVVTSGSPATVTWTSPNNTMTYGGGTNDFATLSGTGSFASGVSLSVATTVGGTLTEALSNFVTFGAYTFSVASAETTGYSISVNSSSIGVYLLGTITGPSIGSNLYANGVAGSLTMTLNQNNTVYNYSATLSTPPAPPPPVPEPATLALLGAGLVGLAVARRRR